MVTAPGSGAEIIPFLKTWVNLPMAIGFTILYAKVSLLWQTNSGSLANQQLLLLLNSNRSTAGAEGDGAHQQQQQPQHSSCLLGVQLAGPPHSTRETSYDGQQQNSGTCWFADSCVCFCCLSAYVLTPTAGQRAVFRGPVLHLHHPLHHLLRSLRLCVLPPARRAAPHRCAAANSSSSSCTSSSTPGAC